MEDQPCYGDKPEMAGLGGGFGFSTLGDILRRGGTKTLKQVQGDGFDELRRIPDPNPPSYRGGSGLRP